MNDVGKIVSGVINLAFFLAAAGQLPNAIHWLQKEMKRPPQLMSISKFNRMLWDEPKKAKNR